MHVLLNGDRISPVIGHPWSRRAECNFRLFLTHCLPPGQNIYRKTIYKTEWTESSDTTYIKPTHTQEPAVTGVLWKSRMVY